ncbi:unnamed protein product [Ranitomeya imitator]|uniref:Septin-type G domain-containing protein n=1 Tax=Ranitomeya imitator TaxID=111125 RepID=A0ABN9LIV8_9NEOB|nr:unnamed protein product [Ranitomeya imitator]
MKMLLLYIKQLCTDGDIRGTRCKHVSCAERLWRKSNLPEDFIHYKFMVKTYNSALHLSKQTYFNILITSLSNNPKRLFDTFQSLLNPRVQTPTTDLRADDLANYFKEKIDHVRQEIISKSLHTMHCPPSPTASSSFSDFEPVTEEEVIRHLASSRPTTCTSDPIPSHLLQSLSPAVPSRLTKIFNLSLTSGYNGGLSTAFQNAVDKPLMLGEGCRSPPLSGHVGFDSMPDQLVNKSINQGFCFNILCVGETGLGKSTLMDTLFNTKFEGEQISHSQPGVQLKSRSYDLTESNVRLKMTIVSTAGFGDQINKEDSYKPIVDFIDSQFEAFLQEELKIKRVLHNYHDSRIHVCLYFIAPTGHSLKSVDLVTMKKLDSKVNIIPVIAKSDVVSKNELTKFKIKITSELVSNGVQIYQFPTDDETVAEINGTMNAHLPFAVVGSTEEAKIGNKMMKVRQYPWGTVQVYTPPTGIKLFSVA